MIKAGMLPKLVNLMTDPKVQNPVCCVLYHLSLEDKVKSMFTYTDCIPIVMRMILDSCEEQVDLEVMALAINLAANRRNAQVSLSYKYWSNWQQTVVFRLKWDT
jgi:hypothetical protein